MIQIYAFASNEILTQGFKWNEGLHLAVVGPFVAKFFLGHFSVKYRWGKLSTELKIK